VAGVFFPHCMAPGQGRGSAYRVVYPDETGFGRISRGTTLPVELYSADARTG
jgi:hypothetical protein